MRNKKRKCANTSRSMTISNLTIQHIKIRKVFINSNMEKNINTSQADISAVDLNRLQESINIIKSGAFMVSSIEESVKEYMPEGSAFIEDTKKAWDLLDEALDILVVNYVPYVNGLKLARSKKQSKDRVAAADLVDDVGDTVEGMIPRIESIAFLVESLGANIAYCGVPTDPDLIVSTSAYLGDELMKIASALDGILDRIAGELQEADE